MECRTCYPRGAPRHTWKLRSHVSVEFAVSVLTSLCDDFGRVMNASRPQADVQQPSKYEEAASDAKVA